MDDKARLTEPLAERAAEEAECLGLSDLDNSHIVEPVRSLRLSAKSGRKAGGLCRLQSIAAETKLRAESMRQNSLHLPHLQLLNCPVVSACPPSA